MSTRLSTLAAIFAVGVASAIVSNPAKATIINFQANLTGSQEVPANASPGIGLGTLVLDDVADTITVNESWSGLTGNASASHIHTGAVGVAGPVTFPFSGVPAATSGAITQQVFSITPAQITALEAGGMYFNIHSGSFPGGEIRGQIAQTPEPTTLGLIGIGAMGLLARRRRMATR